MNPPKAAVGQLLDGCQPVNETTAYTLRQRVARALFAASIFALPAAVVSTPWELWPTVLLALLAVAVAPELMWRALWRHRRAAMALWSLALVVLAVTALSQVVFDLDPAQHDNHTRVLMLPICFLGVLAYRPPRALFWGGALAGLLGVLVVSLVQYLAGEPRVHGWVNAIVFADVVLALLVLAIYLRPPGRSHWAWATGAAIMGVAAIGLSGSRGSWMAAAVALLTGLWLAREKMSWRRYLVLLLAVVALSFALAPSADTRIDQLRQDLAQYRRGDSNSSVGARLELLALAARTTEQHPLTGIGVGRFGEAVRALPDCAGTGAVRNERLCTLRHAHADLPEWAATMGIPGLLCIIALYALPLWLCLRALRGLSGPDRGRSAALAGVVMVVAFLFAGLTQSIYAHQLTAACYAILVGSLLAYARLETAQAGTARESSPAPAQGKR